MTDYRDAKVTIGGDEIQCASLRWSVTPRKRAPQAFPRPRRYEATVTMVFKGREAEIFRLSITLAMYQRHFAFTDGASTGTLARRARYGGRKGRRALRRLRERWRVVRILEGIPEERDG